MLGLGLMTATWGNAASAGCSYTVTNSWGSGFTAAIRVTNDSTTTINGWQVNWAYSKNTVSSAWNARLSGNYSASNIGWNGTLRPGQFAEFGVQGGSAASHRRGLRYSCCCEFQYCFQQSGKPDQLIGRVDFK
jgi:hypothetical protein